MNQFSLFFTFLVLFSLNYSQRYCPIFFCDISHLKKGVCASRSIEDEDYHYHLGTCDHNEICDLRYIDTSNVAYCTKYQSVPTLLPGEFCNTDKECLSSKCELNYCKGLSENENCQSNHQCNQNLYCYKNKCIPFLEENNKEDCGNDSNSLKCDPNLACTNKKCIRFGSLINGNISDNQFACQSGYIYFDSNLNKSFCSQGPFLENSEGNPTECPIDSLCKYNLTYNGKLLFINSSCVCGIRDDIDKLCPLGTGELFQEFSIFINYVKKSNPKCHIEKKWFCQLANYPEDYFIALYSYLKYKMNFNFYQNDDCVKTFFTQDYWNSIHNQEIILQYQNLNLPSKGFSSFYTS